MTEKRDEEVKNGKPNDKPESCPNENETRLEKKPKPAPTGEETRIE